MTDGTNIAHHQFLCFYKEINKYSYVKILRQLLFTAAKRAEFGMTEYLMPNNFYENFLN